MTDPTATAAANQKLHFYQKGTFTVGNRLVLDTERSVQASIDRSNALTCGHRACQGCGEALGARYAMDVAMRATGGNLIAVNATRCWKSSPRLIPKHRGKCLGCTRCSAMPRRSPPE